VTFVAALITILAPFAFSTASISLLRILIIAIFFLPLLLIIIFFSVVPFHYSFYLFLWLIFLILFFLLLPVLAPKPMKLFFMIELILLLGQLKPMLELAPMPTLLT
jgi:hypothetical protein